MRVTFDQVDSTEEICGLFNKVFANQEQMEAKIIQNAQEIEALKPKEETKIEPKPAPKPAPKIKKKGKKKMKPKGLVLKKTIIVVLLLAIASLCYAAYVPGDITSEICANHDMLSIYLRDVTNNMRSNSYVFEPRAAAPTLPAEGMVYYNSGTDTWVGYTDPGGWQNFDLAGGNTLNGAYDSGGAGNGRTINVNDNPVLLTNSDTDNTDILQIYHDGGGATRGLLITIDGTEPAIEIENTSTGYDIEGTGAAWYATKNGILVGASADFTGAAGLTLSNDETITNAANGSITFTDTGGNTLIFDMDDGATSILIDSGDVVTLDWGTVDNFISVETITFDDAATSAISMTGTGTNDLLITQLGATTQSLVLNSDGNVADAVTVTTLGGLDVDTTLSIVLTSVEDQPDAIVIQATLGGIDIITDAAGAGDDIDITATLGSIDLLATEDAASAITLTTNGGVSETIVITSTLGTGADAITIVGTAGGIDIDAVDDINIAVASTAAADDLALVQTGAVNASITLAAAGTGADAIDLNASAGGIDIDAAAAITIDNAAGDVSLISAAGSVVISASEDATDAINIDSTAGGIDIDAAGEAGQDIIITNTGGSIALVATESAVNSIVLQSTLGGIDIQCDAATSEDIDILNTGGSINLVATESAVDSIVLQSTLGGIDIQCDASTSEDIDISNTGGSIVLVSTENAGDSIVLQSTLGGIDIVADASGDEDIDISNTGGNVHIVSDADATDAFDLDVTGTDGGVDIDTTDGPIHLVTAGAINGDISIDASDEILIISSDAAAAGVTIQTDGGAAETIYINSTAGTSASAIYLDADVGGITLLADGAVAGDILIDAEDKITIISYDQDADGIDIGVPATGHANSTIHVHNETGTAADAIEILASVGGITILADGDAAGDILIDAEDSITLVSTDDHAAAIDISVGVGAAASTIIITNTSGTAVSLAAAESAAIQLYADAGGIGLNSGFSGDNAIRIEADGGVDENIFIHSNQGTGADSVTLLTDLGGIALTSTAGPIAINANGDASTFTLTADAGGENLTIAQDGAVDGSVILDSVGTALDAIHLYEHAGVTTGGILVQAAAGVGVSVAGAATSSIQLVSASGGIGIQSGIDAVNAIRIETDAGTAETLVINANQGDTATSITIASDDGGVTISGGANDSITMTTGAAGGAAGNVIFTNGQTRKKMFLPMHVELDGTNPPALSDHGTDGQTNISILEFDANPAGADGDDICYISWMVPDGYITDSARLNIGYLFDTAEGGAGDEAQFDFEVNAVAAGEAVDVAGTALVDQTTVVTDATTDNNLLHITQYNIEVEVIAVDDLVTIQIAVDEDASAWNDSGTLDVLYFEIEWESSE